MANYATGILLTRNHKHKWPNYVLYNPSIPGVVFDILIIGVIKETIFSTTFIRSEIIERDIFTMSEIQV